MSFIRAGVIGYPIRHSKSPVIHNHWINQYGLSGEYKAVEIAPENLKDGVQQLIDEGYAGFNVTIPHKQEIMKLCADINDTAKAIGAVNTVVVRDGALYGMNTDAFGFIENVRKTLPAFDFAKAPAVVLGAGGAARAIVYGLMQAGVRHIVVTNRTEDRARDIAAIVRTAHFVTPALGGGLEKNASAVGRPVILPDSRLRGDDNVEKLCRIEVAPWEDRSGILREAGLLVNTTALGMTGKDPLEIDLALLSGDAAVSDIVYAPLMTELLQAAKARGNPCVTGIGMLLHQARPAFEQWFGVLPDVAADLEEKVLS